MGTDFPERFESIRSPCDSSADLGMTSDPNLTERELHGTRPLTRPAERTMRKLTLAWLAGLPRAFLPALTLAVAVLSLTGGVALGAGSLAGVTIVIDPGHGGWDRGTQTPNGVAEKLITLEIARRARDLLATAGAQVILTRDRDVSLVPQAEGLRADLQARVNIANGAGADLFISIHGDGLDDPRASGPTAYYGPPEGYVYDDLRSELLIRQSRRLAETVLWNTVSTTGLADRGVRAFPFYVLGRTSMPSILFEIGFLTNEADATKLLGGAFQDQVARGILGGALAYFQLQDRAGFVADVTIPDGLIVPPASSFVKTWRIRNSGETTWTSDYTLEFFAGDRLGPATPIPIPGAVGPNETVDLSTTMTTPPGNAGWQFSQWRMRARTGAFFGPVFWALVRSREAYPTDPVAARDDDEFTFFASTGHNVVPPFVGFFEGYGGADVFGRPRTEALEEAGRLVQYFERFRMEWHPEQAGTEFEVQLSLLGDILTVRDRPFARVEPPGPGATVRYFAETGHTLGGSFRDTFEANGDLRIFGYPISELVPEPQNDVFRTVRLVQYFQRAKFVYHAEQVGTPGAVEVLPLGDHYLLLTGRLDPPSPI